MKLNEPDAIDPMETSEDITGLLADLKAGHEEVDSRLMGRIYAQLRRLAASHFRHERPDHTLQPTDLLHEVYPRLMKPGPVPWKNRAHFYAIASRVMRRVLVEHARARLAAKRGGGQAPIPLDDATVLEPETSLDLLGLDEALRRLAAMDPRKGRIVELRVFGGLTIDETAEAMGVSKTTVKSHWVAATLWLRREMNDA